MRSEKLLQIANLIEREMELFDMSTLGGLEFEDRHVCGTPGCISGFVGAILNKQNKPSWMSNTYSWMGLTQAEGDSLCLANNHDWRDCVWLKYHEELGLATHTILHTYTKKKTIHPKEITPQMAITMLRKLASGEWTF